jgi:hypothetical protein
VRQRCGSAGTLSIAGSFSRGWDALRCGGFIARISPAVAVDLGWPEERVASALRLAVPATHIGASPTRQEGAGVLSGQ